jgi:hypothetical protein
MRVFDFEFGQGGTESGGTGEMGDDSDGDSSDEGDGQMEGESGQ